MPLNKADIFQNPPNKRPNSPGAGDDGFGPPVMVPLDRMATGGFRDTVGGAGVGPASAAGTTPGIGGVGNDHPKHPTKSGTGQGWRPTRNVERYGLARLPRVSYGVLIIKEPLKPQPWGVNRGVLTWLKAFGRMEGIVVSILPGH
jgi:hypothetical protein